MPFRSRPLLFALFVTLGGLLAVGLHSQTPSGPSLTILAKEGRRSVPVEIANGQELVGLDDLASAFQLTVQESLGAITVTAKGKTIVLTADQTLASVSGRLISLPSPPVRNGRRWLVPVEFISRALAPIWDARLDFRKAARLLVVGDLRVPRIDVRYEALTTSARLTIDATPRANSTVSQDNQRIVVKFDADALDAPATLLAPQPPQSLVQSIHELDATTIAIDLGPRFGAFKASTEPVNTTMRLVLDITAVPATTDANPPAAPPPPPATELPPAFGQPTTPIRTVAIDPGHGGDDEGVKGAAGAKEKDLVLAVARRAKAVIEARLGIRVLLTRDDDRNIPIDDRTAIANNNKADLFISLHANASMRSTTTGATVFGAAFDEDSVRRASEGGSERVPAFGGGLRDIDMVPWDLAQTHHLAKSTAFAETLEQLLRGRIPLSSHALDRAPLRVLESANMPAVLVELGYLSNPEQEKLLAGDSFQGTFVQTLYDAIVRFRDSLTPGGTQ